MTSGTYRYTAPEGQIAGFIDKAGTVYITEGHHRVAAALEILNETGNMEPFKQLLKSGLIEAVETAPAGARPMPSRSWWEGLRNTLGY